MNSFDEIELQDCPCCHGAGLIEEEGGWCVYVQCLDCGAHTAELSYRNEEERQDAARRVVETLEREKAVLETKNAALAAKIIAAKAALG